MQESEVLLMTDLPNKDLNGRYASVNGLQIYYEVHGTGGAARSAGSGVCERTVLRGLSCTVYRGEKVGLMGPNGAGKSTFLRLLMGHEMPDRGTLRLGQNITVAYYDQEMRHLNSQNTILDEVWQVEPWKTAG